MRVRAKIKAALHVFVFQYAGERGDFIGRAHEIIALFYRHGGDLIALNGHRLGARMYLSAQTRGSAPARWRKTAPSAAPAGSC